MSHRKKTEIEYATDATGDPKGVMNKISSEKRKVKTQLRPGPQEVKIRICEQ